MPDTQDQLVCLWSVLLPLLGLIQALIEAQFLLHTCTYPHTALFFAGFSTFLGKMHIQLIISLFSGKRDIAGN